MSFRGPPVPKDKLQARLIGRLGETTCYDAIHM
jgi:hypothetical protein